MEKLSTSAECLLVAFCQKHGIKLIQTPYEWMAKQNRYYDFGDTKIEAVRKLCKQLNILCEI